MGAKPQSLKVEKGPSKKTKVVGAKPLNPIREWVRAKPQTLKAVGGCETLNPIKGVGGCETPKPKSSGWVRNPEPYKGSGWVRNPKP